MKKLLTQMLIAFMLGWIGMDIYQDLATESSQYDVFAPPPGYTFSMPPEDCERARQGFLACPTTDDPGRHYYVDYFGNYYTYNQ